MMLEHTVTLCNGPLTSNLVNVLPYTWHIYMHCVRFLNLLLPVTGIYTGLTDGTLEHAWRTSARLSPVNVHTPVNRNTTRGKVLSWEYRSQRKRNSRPPASVILCSVSWVENVLLIYYASSDLFVCLHWKKSLFTLKKSPVYGVFGQ